MSEEVWYDVTDKMGKMWLTNTGISEQVVQLALRDHAFMSASLDYTNTSPLGDAVTRAWNTLLAPWGGKYEYHADRDAEAKFWFRDLESFTVFVLKFS